jgi:hypothetical protein
MPLPPFHVFIHGETWWSMRSQIDLSLKETKPPSVPEGMVVPKRELVKMF